MTNSLFHTPTGYPNSASIVRLPVEMRLCTARRSSFFHHDRRRVRGPELKTCIYRMLRHDETNYGLGFVTSPNYLQFRTVQTIVYTSTREEISRYSTLASHPWFRQPVRKKSWPYHETRCTVSGRFLGSRENDERLVFSSGNYCILFLDLGSTNLEKLAIITRA